MVAQEEIDAYEKVSEAIADIMKASSQYNNHLIVTKMKALVPEFKSLNSIFEILDKKNK